MAQRNFWSAVHFIRFPTLMGATHTLLQIAALALLLIAALSLLLTATTSRLFAAEGAVVLMYHRFGESRFPSTSIRLEQFEAHLAELR